MATIATLQRIQPVALRQMILDENCPVDERTFAIVDVRDDDHIGGHIRGSIHCPSSMLPAMVTGLARRLRSKKAVVFHCALSQQRGPGAALRYARARAEIIARGDESGQEVRPAEGKGEGKKEEDGKDGGQGQSQDQEHGQEQKDESGQDNSDPQVVYVLDGGFTRWQVVFGEDERLTEGYRKELWQSM